MSFRLPTFNLTCNIWRQSDSWPTDPPRSSPVCNLQYGRKTAHHQYNWLPDAWPSGWSFIEAPSQEMYLLLPPLTDIRPSNLLSISEGDVVEVPAGSGRLYYTMTVDDVSKGFATEYRVAIIQGYYWAWPVPFP